HTETGRVKGKLGYMSPEAVSGRAVGPVSDVFSAGVVAHELLTAHPLFSAGTDYDTLVPVHAAEIQPPSRPNPAVPAALDDLVLAALERDPEHRLQSAGAFREGLEYVAAQSGLRFSARDVAEWIAQVSLTEDPADPRAALPSASLGGVSPLFSFGSRSSQSDPDQRQQSSEIAGRGAPSQPGAPVRGRTSRLEAVRVDDDRAIAEMMWGGEALPSPSPSLD